MSTSAHEENPPRGLVPALLGGVLLLVLGLYGGWLVFGGSPGGRDVALSGLPSVPGAAAPSKAEVVQIPVLPATQPLGSAVKVQPAASGNGNSGGAPGHAIAVSGVIVGSVGPGAPALLLVTITNPNNQAIEVFSVTGAISSVTTGAQAGKPACSIGWYHVGSFTGSQLVARNSSTTVSLPVTFDNAPATNQDNCKGAQFTYSYSAQARQT